MVYDTHSHAPSPNGAAQPPLYPADLTPAMSPAVAFRNGRIFTATGSRSLADLLVIRDGIIEYVGDSEGYSTTSTSSSDILANARDLNQAVVLPGIIDAHSHLEMMGDDLARLNLRRCGSISDIQSALKGYRAAHPNAVRILGTSWLFDVFEGDAQPTREIIDAVINDVPVYLDANDKHSCWINTAALKELGITKSTVDPRGGKFVKDKDGEPTGFVIETAMTE
jgi:predicted amidohydrolase YtcJ